MRTVLVLVVVLVCAPAARAETLAPDVASKLPLPESVYCAVDEADWQQVLARFNAPPTIRGFTERANHVIHLPAATCAALRVPFFAGGALAYRALYHEYIHAALHTSVESEAECVSLFMFRYWLRRFYGATAAQAQTAYQVAWNDHLALPPDYLGACVFEPADRVSPLNGYAP